jgi:hypothetical protein
MGRNVWSFEEYWLAYKAWKSKGLPLRSKSLAVLLGLQGHSR